MAYPPLFRGFESRQNRLFFFRSKLFTWIIYAFTNPVRFIAVTEIFFFPESTMPVKSYGPLKKSRVLEASTIPLCTKLEDLYRFLPQRKVLTFRSRVVLCTLYHTTLLPRQEIPLCSARKLVSDGASDPALLSVWLCPMTASIITDTGCPYILFLEAHLLFHPPILPINGVRITIRYTTHCGRKHKDDGLFIFIVQRSLYLYSEWYHAL